MSESVAVIGTLAGTVLGFSLSQLAEWRRTRIRRKKMIKALIAELTAIQVRFSGTESTGGITRIYGLPLSTRVFDSVGSEIIGEINDIALLKLQQIYLDVQKINITKGTMFDEAKVRNVNKLIEEVISELWNAVAKTQVTQRRSQ